MNVSLKVRANDSTLEENIIEKSMWLGVGKEFLNRAKKQKL